LKINRAIILLVVLYGCGTWSLTLREKRRLRVFENRMLRRIFGLKRDEVTGEWRKLYNEELNDMYDLYLYLYKLKLSCKSAYSSKTLLELLSFKLYITNKS
jgi:hypothetical protein